MTFMTDLFFSAADQEAIEQLTRIARSGETPRINYEPRGTDAALAVLRAACDAAGWEEYNFVWRKPCVVAVRTK